MTGQNYILLSLLWLAWCFIHSALISVTVTDLLRRAAGDKYRFYRVFFNAFSAATLVPLLMYSRSLRTEPFFTWEGYMRIVQYCLIIIGMVLVLTGARQSKETGQMASLDYATCASRLR